MNTLRNITITLFAVLAFCLSAGVVQAQSLSISPSTNTVPVGGTRTFDIVVNSPGANSGVAVRMNITTSIATFTNAILDGGFTLTTGCADGSAEFDPDELCFDAAQGSAFTNGQTIATITVYGVSDGSLPFTFASGTAFSDGVTTTPYTGTPATYTVSSSILPDAGLVDDLGQSPLLVGALMLIVLGLILNRTPFLNNYAYLLMSESQRKEIDQEVNKNVLEKERSEFESKFAKAETE